MPNLYKENFYRYNPPDISIFRKFGHGLIWRAKFVLDELESDFGIAEQAIANILHKRPDLNEGFPFPYFALYVRLAEADEAIRRLKSMPEEELEKHAKLDGPCDVEGLEIRFDRIYGYTAGLESLQPQLIQDGLNHEMTAKLDEWKRHLDWAGQNADRPYEDNGVDPMESINDFSVMRGDLQYFRRAMNRVRHVSEFDMKSQEAGKPEIGRLPNIRFHQFEMRLLGLDVIFKRTLGNRRAEIPFFWTDPDFWWDHKPERGSSR